MFPFGTLEVRTGFILMDGDNGIASYASESVKSDHLIAFPNREDVREGHISW